MFSIAETAREEGKHLKQELKIFRLRFRNIEQVDRCELKESIRKGLPVSVLISRISLKKI